MGIAIPTFRNGLHQGLSPRLFPTPLPGSSSSWGLARLGGEGGITSAKQDRAWKAARFPVWGAALARLRIRFICSRALWLWSDGLWVVQGGPANRAGLAEEGRRAWGEDRRRGDERGPPSPASPEHLLVVYPTTQPFGTHFPFSRNLPTTFLGRGTEPSLGDVFVSVHFFFGDLGQVLREKRDTPSTHLRCLSLCLCSHNKAHKTSLALNRDLLLFHSFFLLPFPFSPFLSSLPSFLPFCFFKFNSASLLCIPTMCQYSVTHGLAGLEGHPLQMLIHSTDVSGFIEHRSAHSGPCSPWGRGGEHGGKRGP